MNTGNTYRGLLNLDNLPPLIKIINWLMCLTLVTYIISIRGYIFASKVAIWDDIPIVNMLAIISPLCLIFGWLRITGVRWRYILPLPFLAIALIFVSYIFLFIFLILTGATF